MRSLKISANRAQGKATPAGQLAVILAGGVAASGLGFILLGIAFLSLSSKAPPAMVQLESGRTIAMEPLDTDERSPAVIQSFVRDTMTLLYSASGKLPAAGGKPGAADPGVSVLVNGQDAKISTVSSLAGWALSDEDNFRSEFLRQLALATPREVFDAQAEVALAIRHISDPVPGKTKGTWSVTVLSEQIVRSAEDPVGTAVPKNLVVSVRAITPPSVKEYSSDMERQIASIRTAALTVEKIEPYRDGNSPAPDGTTATPTPSPSSSSSSAPTPKPVGIAEPSSSDQQ